jgi:hypothetical protein
LAGLAVHLAGTAWAERLMPPGDRRLVAAIGLNLALAPVAARAASPPDGFGAAVALLTVLAVAAVAARGRRRGRGVVGRRRRGGSLGRIRGRRAHAALDRGDPGLLHVRREGGERRGVRGAPRRGRGGLELDAPVARYWPEFAASGKAGAEVGWCLDHRAGLPWLAARDQPDEAFADWDWVSGALASQAPVTRRTG